MAKSVLMFGCQIRAEMPTTCPTVLSRGVKSINDWPYRNVSSGARCSANDRKRSLWPPSGSL